jgi:uncharacterized protein (TIGR00645 family)
MSKNPVSKFLENITEYLIFASRWIQAPMYLGLIFGSGLYLFKFFEELMHISQHLYDTTEVQVMLGILGLIDASMVLNLLVIVIVGGYSIFTSKIDFDQTEDRPQWLDHLDAGRLKIKLATSLASISGVHLLKTFIDIHSQTKKSEDLAALEYEIIIHLVFIVSALMLAWVEQILAVTERTTSQIVKHHGVIPDSHGGKGIIGEDH